MALNLSFNPVRRFTRPTVVSYQQQFSAGGRRRWRGYGKFDLEVDLDPRVPETQVQHFEYRQFIRGVVWYRRWMDDTAFDWVKVDRGVADRDKAFKIPAYAGAPTTSGLPAEAVAGVGLDDWRWKEDGIIRSGQAVRYGYRTGVKVSGPRERDEWLGPVLTSFQYRLRDEPSLEDAWGTVSNWIELYFDLEFKGFVVELDTDLVTPLRVVEQRSWNFKRDEGTFWIEKH
jgi:hypothetical protein